MTDIVERLRDPSISMQMAVKGGVLDAIRFEAAAEIERLRAASEWRDISTAPRDGSKPILGYQETPGDLEYQWGVCWAIDMLDGSLVWLGSGGLTPTLWMPIPAPPQRNEVKP